MAEVQATPPGFAPENAPWMAYRCCRLPPYLPPPNPPLATRWGSRKGHANRRVGSRLPPINRPFKSQPNPYFSASRYAGAFDIAPFFWTPHGQLAAGLVLVFPDDEGPRDLVSLAPRSPERPGLYVTRADLPGQGILIPRAHPTPFLLVSECLAATRLCPSRPKLPHSALAVPALAIALCRQPRRSPEKTAANQPNSSCAAVLYRRRHGCSASRRASSSRRVMVGTRPRGSAGVPDAPRWGARRAVRSSTASHFADGCGQVFRLGRIACARA
jgi:hypothetical protein